MNLLFRFLIVTAVAFFGHRSGLLRTSRLRLYVLLNDLDLNLHMNNGRYLSVCDLGKIDVMIRSGTASIAIRRKWRPLIGGSVIRHRFGMGPFRRFELVTRVLCWDDKWFYFQHRIETEGGTAAMAFSKALLHDGYRSVSPEEVLAALKLRLTAPPIPDAIAEWLLLDGMLSADATEKRVPVSSPRQSPSG